MFKTALKHFRGFFKHWMNPVIKHAIPSMENYPVKLKPNCGPIPNVMAALPNIGGALCSMPQTLADRHYKSAVQ